MPLAIVHDLRNQPVVAHSLPSPQTAVWYAEGVRVDQSGASYAPRTDATSARRHVPLVLWSIPPAPDVLQALLETVQPDAIYLCARDTADDAPDSVLRHVAGMCKYALAYEPVLDIERMAARLGTTEAVIHRSLLWLEARGLITLVEWQQADAVRIAAGVGTPVGNSDERDAASDIFHAELEQELAEVRAYRRYYLRADLRHLGLVLPAK